MTDRELLELAAKAAGIDGKWSPANEAIHVNTAPLRNYVLWNPLTDDGDALRLAVKLELSPDFCGDWVFVGNAARDETRNPVGGMVGDDPYAATRRAIVRAAAEIGRGVDRA